MEPEQVEAVILGDADDPLPARDVRRRMPGEGEDGAFQRAAEEGLAAVDRELSAEGADLAEAEALGSAARSFSVDRRGQAMERGMELVPEGASGADRDLLGERPPWSIHETRVDDVPWPAAFPGPAIASFSTPSPGRPVALPIRPLTVTDRVAT